MTDAEATVRFAIASGIAVTGSSIIKPGVDITPLVDSIIQELTSDTLKWAIAELLSGFTI